MVSKAIIGKGFVGTMGYLLEDKLDRKKPRGTIIQYNNCFGSKKELVKQFIETSKLSSRNEKPVFHCIFSFDPSDKISENTMQEISFKFAEELQFEEHQWISVLHDDTQHAHFHMVINRVNPITGKTLSDSHNYIKMVNFCRKMEKEYGLEEVRSPEKFLPKDQQNQPRFDSRKEKLKGTIKNALTFSKSIPEFKDQLKLQGYETEIGRGIAFIDDKKVRFKGSQIGYSLDDIKAQIIKNLDVKLNYDRPKTLNISL